MMEQILSYIPLDIALIAENFDRFLYGVWMTLNLTFLALLLGGLMAVPMAIARLPSSACFCFHRRRRKKSSLSGLYPTRCASFMTVLR